MRTCWKLLVGALAALATVACAELNSDINRVHPPYQKKSMFEGSWYFKKTVIDNAANNNWVTTGDGDWAVIERLRWKITERYLYGYRDWEYVPGSETGEYEGADYYGSPVVMYVIKEHFDIRRSYNPQTGEETNTIDKNHERPWNEREYMVVDWAMNMAPNYGLVSYMMYWDEWTPFVPLKNITSNAYYVQEHEIDTPERARFSDNYIDFVGKYTLWPDLIGCLYQDYGVIDCAPGEVHVRHSFLKADPDNDYVPMPYPDAVDLVDNSGEYVRHQSGPYAGMVKRVPIFERFGDYRLDRLTYDADYALTDSGVMRRANRFNIWERSRDDSGNLIPYHLRTPKPIIYYLNVEFPDDEDMDPGLREKYAAKKAAYLIGQRWNKPFREVVAMLRVMSRNNSNSVTKAQLEEELADVPDMFVVKDNDCNIDNVKRFVADHPELDDTLTQHMGGISMLNKLNLARVCTLIESGTEGTDHAFTWQRHGDLRYNMLIWIDKYMPGMGWAGLGPMYMDPITGQTIHSVAHYAGALMETSITAILDYIDAMNGLIPDYDIITGQDINRYISKVRKQLKSEAATPVSARLIDDMESRFRALGDRRERLLRQVSPDSMQARLGRIKGTPQESLLIGEDDWRAARAMLSANSDFAESMPELIDLASPVREFRSELPLRTRQRDLETARRTRDMPKFYDGALLATALELKDMSREERRAALRYKLFDAVMTHEVGHNVGMRHNFSASTDALNFGADYWYLMDLPANLTEARAQLVALGDEARVAQVDRCLVDVAMNPSHVATTQECLGAWQDMYSSIMDYHGKMFGDFSGLNQYDESFVHFVYGGILSVFDDGVVNETVLGQGNPHNPGNPDLNADGAVDGNDIRAWLFYNDYKKIPTLFNGGSEGIHARHYEKYDWGAVQTNRPEPRWTVPFKFCSDEYAGMYPDCRMSDYGVTQTEITQTDITRYKEYYFFTHFNRGRVNWYWWNNAVNSNVNMMLNFLTTYQWMYYYRATDPAFFSTDAGKDFLRATVMGLNTFADILGTPASGSVYELDNTGGMLISSQRTGYWRVAQGTDFVGGGTPDLPTSGGLGVMLDSTYYNSCDRPANAWADIALGDGRPFYFGWSADYEDWLFTYVGSYFDKDYAMLLLAYPYASFPEYQAMGGAPGYDPRTFSLNYYRLFKKEVLQLYYGAIANDLNKVAPVVRKQTNGTWEFEPRKVIDLSGELPNYDPGLNVKLVLPSTAYNIRFYGMYYGAALMTSLLDTEQDFTQLLKVAVKGQQDDITDFDRVAPEDKAEFVHPISGVTFRALKQGSLPIGYKMVEEANRRKAIWEEYQACVDDPTKADGRCQCVYQSQEIDPDTSQYVCPPREVIPCVSQDRVVNAQNAMESMEQQVELLQNARTFFNWYEYTL
ncbi:MAG: hypothetical protein JXR83_13745 [Deltaproteobacteria bacterium]|nr:hypothetical protein [Deltaproteobacteria bacterium]